MPLDGCRGRDPAGSRWCPQRFPRGTFSVAALSECWAGVREPARDADAPAMGDRHPWFRNSAATGERCRHRPPCGRPGVGKEHPPPRLPLAEPSWRPGEAGPRRQPPGARSRVERGGEPIREGMETHMGTAQDTEMLLSEGPQATPTSQLPK